MTKRAASIGVMLACALLVPRAAFAGGDNAAAAQALFEEARALMASGNYAAGCAKLEGSQSLDPGPGTQYNLALCYEKSGRSASAWATYLEAAAAYKATGRPEWESKARDRAAALAGTLARLKIVLAPGAPPDAAITRDGAPVVASELGTAIPVDPGPHVVEAKAAGRSAFRVSSVAVAGQTRQIDVTLDPAGASPPSSTPDHAGRSPDHTLAYVVGSVGVAGLAFGAVAGLVAVNKNASSTAACPSDGVCRDASARSDNRAAGDWATVSTVGFIAGGVLLAAGVVLYVVAPGGRSTTASTTTTRLGPVVGIGPAGLEGRW